MGEMPQNIDEWDLRDDQQYLYSMMKAVASGVCDQRLASLKPGKLNLSRWLTTASRILRLYVTKSEPSETLKHLVFFVMKIYGPFWFLIKSQPKAVYGSRHLFQYIKWIKQLPEYMQEIVQRSIQINGFFAHPENILLSLIVDECKEVRNDAFDIILKARARKDDRIRQFNVPTINFNAESLKNIINWDEAAEPPCTQFYSQHYLEYLKDSDEIVSIPGKKKLVKINCIFIFIPLIYRIVMPLPKH